MPIVSRLRHHGLKKYLGGNMDFMSDINFKFNARFIEIKCNDQKKNKISASNCFRDNKI